jgi:hypothetical protein
MIPTEAADTTVLCMDKVARQHSSEKDGFIIGHTMLEGYLNSRIERYLY